MLTITIKARDIEKAKKKFLKIENFLINSFKSLENNDIIFLANPSQKYEKCP